MAKCELCNEKKGRRECPALSKVICTFCCATKREKEIKCPPDCKYLTSGKEFKTKKEIEKEVRNGFYGIKEDIFQKPEAVTFINEFEKFLAEEFYENYDVNDHKIYNALSKVYAIITKMEIEIKFEDKYEEIIVNKYFELDEKHKNLALNTKKDIIIKTLDNINKETGGEYCDRSYLRERHIKNGGKVFF